MTARGAVLYPDTLTVSNVPIPNDLGSASMKSAWVPFQERSVVFAVGIGSERAGGPRKVTVDRESERRD